MLGAAYVNLMTCLSLSESRFNAYVKCFVNCFLLIVDNLVFSDSMQA